MIQVLQVMLQVLSGLSCTKDVIFPLKHSSIFHPIRMQSVFNWDCVCFFMNIRFVIVGVVLAIVVTLAVIIGSPALGGFDAMR